MSETIRIRTTPNGNDSYLKVKIDQEFDFIEVLSLKISQEEAYRNFCSDYGAIVGRVIINSGFGLPNARVSVFIPIDEEDSKNSVIKGLYPYEIITDKDSDGVRYNLLPKNSETNNECFTPVGTFPNKREILDNEDLEYVYCKYYKFTTTTNSAGDFMLFGVPLGTYTIHVDADISDIGVASQRPYDLISQGTPLKFFESPTKFKGGTNLDKLVQIKSTNYAVNVQPFWGDTDTCEVGISRADIDMNYTIRPSAIFMGSIFGDQDKHSINKRCRPRKKLGNLCEQVAGEGSIEMIRENVDGTVEQFDIEGGRVIDEDGTWAYQLPMNLDYVITDEFGNLVASDDPNKGIPTRARVRFRIGMDNTGGEGRLRTRAKYLVPNNPRNSTEVDYSFDETTKKSSFRDLYWNKIYSVSNFIPRFQTNSFSETRAFTGIKDVDSCAGDKTPFPFNRVNTDFNPLFLIICLIIKIIAFLIYVQNKVIIPIINFIITVINILIGFWNGLINKLCDLSNWEVLGIKPFGAFDFVCSWVITPLDFVPCQTVKCPFDPTESKSYAPGCTSSSKGFQSLVNRGERPNCYPGDAYGHPDSITEFAAGLDDCIAFTMARTLNIFEFDFYNDWINGSLFGYLLKYKKKRRKREVFCEYECSGGNFTPENGVDGNKNNVGDNDCRSNFLLDRCFNSDNNTSSNGKNSQNTTYSRNLTEGLIKKLDIFRNGKKISEEFYYAATRHNVNDKLFATDVICLGSVFDCDWQGIPKIQQLLIPTTYKTPPDTFEPTDDNKIETTGMVGEGGNTRGLFFEVNCIGVHSDYQQVLNMRHICEMGVDLDELRYITSFGSNTLTPEYPDAIISVKDIDETGGKWFRDVFYGVNKDMPTSVTSFNYGATYTTDFNLQSQAAYPFATVGSNQNGQNYIDFRGYPSNSNNGFGQPKHSFYFYFGISPSKSALEKMNQRFFTRCYPKPEKEFNIIASSIAATLNNPTVGSLTFSVVSGTGPYTYTISGPNGYNTTGTISLDNNGNPIPVTINGNTGSYNIEVVDANGNVSTTTISIDGLPALFATAKVTKNCSTVTTPDGQITIDSLGGGSGSYTFTLYKNDGTTVVNGPTNISTSSIPVQINGLLTNIDSDGLNPPSFGYVLKVSDSTSTITIKNLKVEGPTPLVLTQSTNPTENKQTTCWGSADGAFKFTLAGGIAPYTITTTGPATFGSNSSLVSTTATRGQYTITVVDAFGTTLVQNFNVTSKNAQMVAQLASTTAMAKQCNPNNYIIPFKITSGAPLAQNATLPSNIVVQYNINGNLDSNSNPIFTQVPTAIYQNASGDVLITIPKSVTMSSGTSNLTKFRLRFVSLDGLCYSNEIQVLESQIRLPNTTLSINFSGINNARQCNPNVVSFKFNISHIPFGAVSGADSTRYPYTFSYKVNGVQKPLVTFNTLAAVQQGITTTMPSVTNNANIRYVITDSKGCTASGSFNITMPTAILNATWSYNNSANPQTKALNVTGGIPPYTYSPAISSLKSVKQIITVTDSKGCTFITPLSA